MKLFKKRFKSDHLTDDDKWVKLYYKPFEYKIWQIKCKISDWQFKRYINKQIKDGYIDKNLAPLKCPFCNSIELESYDFYRHDQGFIEEYSVRCKHCQKDVGHWAYGGWSL